MRERAGTTHLRVVSMGDISRQMKLLLLLTKDIGHKHERMQKEDRGGYREIKSVY